MKKITVFLVTAIFMIAFTACSGAKKTEAPVEEPVKTEVVEVVETSEVPVLTPAEMLKSFQEYAKAYGEAFNNISKDHKKFSELSKQSTTRVEEMEKIKGELNKKQLADYELCKEIILKVNRGGK